MMQPVLAQEQKPAAVQTVKKAGFCCSAPSKKQTVSRKKASSAPIQDSPSETGSELKSLFNRLVPPKPDEPVAPAIGTFEKAGQVVVISVVSAKGGVGKTTLSACLAMGLAPGRDVLAVDLDPQNALRLHLGVPASEIDGACRATLEERSWQTAVYRGGKGRPSVLPYGNINETDRDQLEALPFQSPGLAQFWFAQFGARPPEHCCG
jgi:Mrp family chromosome partitioning ATPase